MKTFKIAPSILSADFAKFGEEIKRLEAAKADWIHIDVMDGHFVDNLTFGAPAVAAMRPYTKLFFDCHLMVEKPEKFIAAFAHAGADSLSIHVEATSHIHGALQQIKSAGMRAAVVINPGTAVSAIVAVLKLVDMVLVMTVNPGFGGQSFIPDCMDKVRELVKIREEKAYDFDIEIDGGIDEKSIVIAKEAGANAFVAGSYVYKANPAEQIEKLKKALEKH